MFRAINAGVFSLRFHTEGIEQAVIVILKTFTRVRRDVELIGPLDEIEAVDQEDHLAGTGELDRRVLFEVSVRPVAAHPLGVENADAEDEVRDG